MPLADNQDQADAAYQPTRTDNWMTFSPCLVWVVMALLFATWHQWNCVASAFLCGLLFLPAALIQYHNARHPLHHAPLAQRQAAFKLAKKQANIIGIGTSVFVLCLAAWLRFTTGDILTPIVLLGFWSWTFITEIRFYRRLENFGQQMLALQQRKDDQLTSETEYEQQRDALIKSLRF